MLPQPLTAQQCRDYQQDGFLILRSFFDREEISLLRDAARRDQQLDQRAISRADGSGRVSRLALWYEPGDGIYGMIARSDAVVGMVQQVLDDEPYYYHSKMIMKEPRVGGAWEWHQDYVTGIRTASLSPTCAAS